MHRASQSAEFENALNLLEPGLLAWLRTRDLLSIHIWGFMFVEAESDAERQVVGETSQAVPGAKGKAELLRMLRWACEDEVAHKEEAQQRSLDPRGGQPWFGWVDPAWQWLVGKGSAAAAGLARRL